MASVLLLGLLVMTCLCMGTSLAESPDPAYDENYEILWGGNRASSLDGGKEIQLSMDNSSGSGFGSKLDYGSGFFKMRIKLHSNTSNHDELDFEFLGNKQGRPIILQTNIFINGEGNREQRIKLWFDPFADFHTYGILWNPYQLAFFVDETPIRVFANKTSMGISYPTQPMQILASIWNGEDWATDGGKTKTNWTYAPFKAHYQGFDVQGCSSTSPSCSSDGLWWNASKYRRLSDSQMGAYEKVKKNYMTYNYCTDRSSMHPFSSISSLLYIYTPDLTQINATADHLNCAK
ncbi:putative xyloglucan endotransglucosylase/hydrolase protein 1 [Acorus gramineus]|uniref:Xyloglucan endotransglucosylase/hydrolase n=1 Tax=Acorus gramineus TaxID=55184 RepID=A0AAV9AZC9_ACOGR|nr:putative xyloglucan endotransglucosylase/hydrolase protein 1 [Acorus gramineus]